MCRLRVRSYFTRGISRSLVANILDYDLEESEFKLQLRYDVYFWNEYTWEKYEPLLPSQLWH